MVHEVFMKQVYRWKTESHGKRVSRKARKEKTNWYNSCGQPERTKEEKKNWKTASTSGFGVVLRPKPPRNKKVSWKKNSSNALKDTKRRGSLWRRRQKLQLSQSSSTKSQHLDADFKALMDLVKRGWDQGEPG